MEFFLSFHHVKAKWKKTKTKPSILSFCLFALVYQITLASCISWNRGCESWEMEGLSLAANDLPTSLFLVKAVSFLPILVSLPGSQWASFYILYREVENLGHISNSQKIRGGSGTLAPTCCLSDGIISLLSFFVFVCRGHSAVASPLHPPVRTGPKSLCSQLTLHSTEESCLHAGIAHPIRTSASL